MWGSSRKNDRQATQGQVSQAQKPQADGKQKLGRKKEKTFRQVNATGRTPACMWGKDRLDFLTETYEIP